VTREICGLTYFRELGRDSDLDVRDLRTILEFDGSGETPCERQGFSSGRDFNGNHRQGVRDATSTSRTRSTKEDQRGPRRRNPADRDRSVDPVMVSTVHICPPLRGCGNADSGILCVRCAHWSPNRGTVSPRSIPSLTSFFLHVSKRILKRKQTYAHRFLWPRLWHGRSDNSRERRARRTPCTHSFPAWFIHVSLCPHVLQFASTSRLVLTYIF